jgi:hypothetical protein
MMEIQDAATAISSVTFADLAMIITAIGALGTAAFGLVDVTKLFWGGIGNVGFGFVERALAPFDATLAQAVGEGTDWRILLKAHWLNGRPKGEQKAIAKSLIRLGLSPDNAPGLAKITGVSAQRLTDAATLLATGGCLQDAEINALGRFDAAIEARMDAAFERADQRYRSASRDLAAIVAVILAIVAGGALFKDEQGQFALAGYLGSRLFLASILAGLIAVPLAPISKDLVSALSAAMRAVKAVKG